MNLLRAKNNWVNSTSIILLFEDNYVILYHLLSLLGKVD